jgi:hypothetical protein
MTWLSQLVQTTPPVRVEAAQAMMDAVQVWPQLLQVAGDLVAKAQDWPGADDLAERLKKTIPQQFLDPEDREGPDPQVQELQQQLQALAQEYQQLKFGQGNRPQEANHRHLQRRNPAYPCLV